MTSDLIVDEPREIAASQPEPLSDLRHAMMTLPVERQNVMLAEYKARRDNFRAWLMSQLIEGTHYGVVPGCEPKSQDRADGRYYGVWNKKKSAFDWHHERQWKPKPSLYAAGADFICDVCGVRDEYDTDAVGWQQMGAKSGNAVVKCRLYSRANNQLIGESLGAYYHQYDPNNALKMASKCAKVGAVINAYDLRDLFTQDDPNDRPPPNDNPPENDEAPKAKPRAQRAAKPAGEVSQQQFGHVWAEWWAKNQGVQGDLEKARAEFKAFVLKCGGRGEWNTRRVEEWKTTDYKACCSALSVPTLEEMA